MAIKLVFQNFKSKDGLQFIQYKTFKTKYDSF